MATEQQVVVVVQEPLEPQQPVIQVVMVEPAPPVQFLAHL
jgi:hypothetical protein